MTHYVEIDHELEILNEETGEYEYPTITVEVAIYRERDEDGYHYTTGEIYFVDGGHDLSSEEEEAIIDEAVSGFSWG